MFRKLLPHRELFFDYFERHAAISYEAAQFLIQIIETENKTTDMFLHARHLENEGDLITHQCVAELHKTFITPMDRMDIHRLITTLDNISDEIEGLAKRIFLYKLQTLNSPYASSFGQILLKSVHEILLTVKEFRKMKLTDAIKERFVKINELENEADSLLSEALENLFEKEQDTKELIKWKEIYEHLERATDVCEDASNIIEGILIENE